MTRSSDEIRGFTVPVLTPFHVGGAVDEEGLRKLVDFYIDAGVDAMFFLGSFGNGPALKPEERKRVAEVAIEQVAGRVATMVHVGAVDPQTTVELGVHARECGADVIAVVGPYYYSDHTEWEIINHFRMVDEAVGLPILVYNNKEYSGYDMPPPLMNKIRRAAPHIFGSKLAAGNVDQAKRYLAAMEPPFSSFIPINNIATALVQQVKLTGSISPPLAAWPELGIELIRAYEAEDILKTVELQRKADAFSRAGAAVRGHGRGSQCAVMQARGLPIEQYPRWPTEPITDEQRRQLHADLAAVGYPVREAVPV
jgi:2-dehydro-3-deoxy-D-pentonate aldolase